MVAGTAIRDVDARDGQLRHQYGKTNFAKAVGWLTAVAIDGRHLHEWMAATRKNNKNPFLHNEY
jgi:hypothetical protein